MVILSIIYILNIYIGKNDHFQQEISNKNINYSLFLKQFRLLKKVTCIS